jgi:hypothetical protein
LIDITPAPILTWLKRLDDGVLGVVKVLGGVFILRRIAATHMAALRAKAEVDPRVADF